MSRAALAACACALAACGSEAPVNPETEARERFIRELTVREGVPELWDLMSRSDVVFEDGWSAATMIDPTLSPKWTDAVPAQRTVRKLPARWLGPTAHLRLRARGDQPMRLRIWGAVNVEALFTRPRLTVTFDGRELSSRVIGDDGALSVEATIPADRLGGWSDVYVTLSSVGEPWRDAGGLRVARVEGVAWEPAR